MKYILIALGLILLTLIIAKIDEPRQERINAHNCAVLGKEADCKTPLPTERRLR